MSMSSFSKIPAVNSFPLDAQNNMMIFQANNSGEAVDFSTSYIEMEIGLLNSDGSKYTNTKNLIVGDSGTPYTPSAPVRQSRLSNSSTGTTYQDLMYVNIIDNNINHHALSENEQRCESLYNGSGHVNPANKEVVSIFNNSYADANPVLKVPFRNLFPGSLGVSDAVPVGTGVLEHRMLLENQFNWLTKAVPVGYYPEGIQTISAGITCNNIGISAVQCTASQVGSFTAGFLSPQDEVIITGLLGTSPNTHASVSRYVNVYTPDAGATAGNFTFSGGAISTTVGFSNVSVVKVSNTNDLGCETLDDDSAVLTLNANIAYTEIPHLEVGTTCRINATSVDAYGVQTSYTLKSKVVDLSPGEILSSITFADSLKVPVNGVLANIWFEPLYTNWSDISGVKWQIAAAHMVLVRKNIKMKSQKVLVSAFESLNVACQKDMGRFLFTFQTRPETFNAYALTPTDDNMYSQTQDSFGSFLFTLDDKPLTSIYLQLDKSTARDNLQRVMGNSPVYKVKNLKPTKDSELVSELEVQLYPAKLYQSTINDEPEVLQGNERKLRVELVPKAGKKTPQTQVFLCVEKWVEL